MADPTVILDDAGEVMRMTNEEGDPKISQVMEAQDSKGNPEEDSSSDFFIELNVLLSSPKKTWPWSS